MINLNECIGCQACVDICPKNAITFEYDVWGEGRANINAEKCIECGLCDICCPNVNIELNNAQTTVFAVVSKSNRNTGSSGGVFYELASSFIGNGGVVFGAAFDDNLKLKHKKVSSVFELVKFCKSKYLHSDMSGIYNQISECLNAGNRVMFVGTPCQVSAVKNLFSKKYSRQLLLVDFLCHGAGTQKVFDICIKAEEEKKGGKITNFSFRAKTRNGEHSYKYTLKKGNRLKEISGIPAQFPYYNSYLEYSVFCESCYNCKYPRSERVGDITLGDFWGIQNYNRKLVDRKGVSMICVNTTLGREYFEKIKSLCEIYEYPIENAKKKNQAFRENVNESCYLKKKAYVKLLLDEGEAALVNELSCKTLKKVLIYHKIPLPVRTLWKKLRRRK